MTTQKYRLYSAITETKHNTKATRNAESTRNTSSVHHLRGLKVKRGNAIPSLSGQIRLQQGRMFAPQNWRRVWNVTKAIAEAGSNHYGVNATHYRDFSNRQPYHNIPCRLGEVLVPVVLSDEMRVTLTPMGLDVANAETWHFPKSVPVVFTPVPEQDKEAGMISFYDQVRWYLQGESSCASYQNEVGDGCPVMPAEDDTEVETFIRYAEGIRKEYGILLRGLMAGKNHREMIEILGISGCKTLQHRTIRQMLGRLQKLYLNYNQNR